MMGAELLFTVRYVVSDGCAVSGEHMVSVGC